MIERYLNVNLSERAIYTCTHFQVPDRKFFESKEFAYLALDGFLSSKQGDYRFSAYLALDCFLSSKQGDYGSICFLGVYGEGLENINVIPRENVLYRGMLNRAFT
jgi:hypothetical protein